MVGDRAEVFSAPYRYVLPSDLDLMARLAGLRRRERWATWGRDPFTGDSPSHVLGVEEARRRRRQRRADAILRSYVRLR